MAQRSKAEERLERFMEQIKFESGLEEVDCWYNERKVWSGQENEYTVMMEYDMLTVDVFRTSLCDAETIIGRVIATGHLVEAY